jgi:GNAT superfamily N-acetyltransferase
MSSKESERVVVHEERGDEFRTLVLRRVDIKYSDGDLFYSGWIQDFGNALTGPTVFEQDYNNYDLEREHVIKRQKYWLPITYNQENIRLRDATTGDIDDIIDLTFQNYFDGGYNRISAYQGLNHKIDTDHVTLGFTVDNSIFGYLYIDLIRSAFRGEAYFDSLFCAHSVRNRGIGLALLSAGLDRVKGKGFEKVSGMIIGTRAHCEHIAKMLDKHGFKVLECLEKGEGWLEVNVLKTF